jgi:hypothetical protein
MLRCPGLAPGSCIDTAASVDCHGSWLLSLLRHVSSTLELAKADCLSDRMNQDRSPSAAYRIPTVLVRCSQRSKTKFDSTFPVFSLLSNQSKPIGRESHSQPSPMPQHPIDAFFNGVRSTRSGEDWATWVALREYHAGGYNHSGGGSSVGRPSSGYSVGGSNTRNLAFQSAILAGSFYVIDSKGK